VHSAAELFVDAPVTYRQTLCPGCLTALSTEIIAEADRHLRMKQLKGTHHE
jgi:hypothetical protein